MGFESEVEGLSFLDKLNFVLENGDLDFWEDRKNPPNLTVDEFQKVIARVDKVERLSWVLRKSSNGPQGRTGDDRCFKFECEVSFGGIFTIEAKRFFIKGYFFHKNDLRGITIQSFREV